MPRQPMNDLVVVLPGIMGSRLADAEIAALVGQHPKHPQPLSALLRTVLVATPVTPTP